MIWWKDIRYQGALALSVADIFAVGLDSYGLDYYLIIIFVYKLIMIIFEI